MKRSKSPIGRLASIALALGCLICADASALEDVWGNPITLTFQITPDHLVLGNDPQAQILVAFSTGAKPSEAEAAPLRLWTSAGSLSAPRPAKEGWLATYTPPKTRFPQVAVITASLTLGEERLNGWTVVPLHGKGLARVRARPRAKVWVEIDQRRFGPVRADRAGRAAIPIIVPPGVDHATSAGKRIPLALPKFNRLAAVLDASSMECDPNARTALWLYAVEADGRPAAMAELWVEADQGQVAPVESLGPGAFRAWYRPPASLGKGQDQVQASLRGAPGSEVSLAVELRAGPPYRVELRLSAPAWTAGSEKAIVVSAQAFDQADNPTEAPIELEADFGALGKPERIGPGKVQASLKPPDQLLGHAAISLRARIPYGPRAEAQLGLSPAQTRWLSIDPPSGPVTADGKNEISLTVRTRDRFDNPTPTPKLSIRARLGRARIRYGAPDGTASLTYRPPLLVDAKTETLTVSGAGDLETELRLSLRP